MRSIALGQINPCKAVVVSVRRLSLYGGDVHEKHGKMLGVIHGCIVTFGCIVTHRCFVVINPANQYIYSACKYMFITRVQIVETISYY